MTNRNSGLAAVAFALGLAGSATAAPAAITQPDWIRKPDGESLARHYPPLATELTLPGYAVISCQVTTQGALTDCHADLERPLGMGFGQAAVNMAGDFRMKPQTLNGQPVEGGTVRIPIKFVSPPALPSTRLPPPVSEEAAKQALRVVDTAKVVERALAAYEVQAKKIESMSADTLLSRVAADAFRRAALARREDFRTGFARSFASVFSEAEMSALAEFNLASGDQSGANETFTTVQRLVGKDYARNLLAASHAAFCAKAACVGPPEIQRVWRAEPRETSRIDNPQWTRQPSAGALLRAVPKVTAPLGLTAVVRLTCKVAAKGDLADCSVDEQAPAGLGFGRAAMALTGEYRLSPIQISAGAVGRRVTVRVGFSPSDPAEPLHLAHGSARAVSLAQLLASEQQIGDESRLQTELQIADYATNSPKDSDPKVYDVALDAYRAGAKQALADYIDLSMANLSTAYSEPQLEVRAAFLATPAGKVQKARSKELLIALQNAQVEVADKISADAHAAFCSQRDCSAAPPQAPSPTQTSAQAPKAVSSAPSTRKP